MAKLHQSNEKLYRDFTKLIPEIRDLEYNIRLEKLKLQSIQRRFNQYRVIYMKKIQLWIVPNPWVHMEHDYDSRNGYKFEMPSKNVCNEKCNLSLKWQKLLRKIEELLVDNFYFFPFPIGSAFMLFLCWPIAVDYT